jgi:hypothetical protein
VLSGVPMQAKQLDELMQHLRQPKLAHMLPTEEEDSGGNPPSTST